jgi:hypothetical protein
MASFSYTGFNDGGSSVQIYIQLVMIQLIIRQQ